MATITEPGIYPDMKRADYARLEAVNYSLLKNFRRSPAHAREYMLHPQAPSVAMDFGTAFHTAILEPAKFASEYIAAPKCDRRTKVGKEAWTAFEEANRSKTVLDCEDMDTIKAMSEACLQNEVVREILSSPGKNEVALVWDDTFTGLRCKALIDRITRFAGWTVAVDFKTADDAQPWAFSNAAAKYAYAEQAAFYLSGLNALHPVQRRWLWVAVEKERPYGVAVYEPDRDALAQGQAEFMKHLETYKQCTETGIWPCYPSGVQALKLPKWAFTED